MKWVLILLWAVLSLSSLFAQSPREDSLMQAWENKQGSLSSRLEALLDLSDLYSPERASQSLALLEEGMQLAREAGNDTFPIHISYYMGVDYGFTGQMEKAKAAFKWCVDQSLEKGYYDQLDFYVKYVSWTHSLTQTIDELPAYLQEVIPRIEAAPVDSFMLGKIYRQAGQGFSTSGRYVQSLFWEFKALGVLESLPQHLAEKAEIYQTLAYSLAKMENHERSEFYMKKSLAIAYRLRDSLQLASGYSMLANLYNGMEAFEKAISFTDSVFWYNTQQEKGHTHFSALSYRGKALSSLDRQKEALPLLEEALKYFSANTANNEWAAYLHAQKGIAYLKLGRYAEAIREGLAGLALAEGLQKESMENHEVLYQAYEKQGQIGLAYDHYQQFVSLRDAIVSERNAAQATRMELENQFARERLADSLASARLQIEQELAFQQKLSEQKMARNLWLGLGILATFIALAAYSRLRFVKRTERALKEKNAIIEAEKVKAQASERAKHQFLANMSHEIRTPMNAIKGMTDILLRRNPKSEQLAYLGAIKDSSNSLLVIINDILDLSKIEAGKIDLEKIPFSLTEVVENVNTIMQFKAEEKGLLLRTHVEEGLADRVIGDPTRLHQVLLNLTGNAIKFTEKGLVNILVKAVETSDQQMLAQFCVSDTGVGIGEDRLEKIFESFEQAYSDTTRKFGGTGLGLSISKKLVEIQGGEIWAESEKGKGSQFYVKLPFPLAKPESQPAVPLAPAEQEPIAEQLKGIRILLVEDNSFNAIVAEEELEDAIEGVEVDLAENGLIAVEKVQSGSYDLILMDVQMPIMNGYEATEKIRSLDNGKSGIPIIAMTANVLKEEVARCYAAGMDDFIGKPFDTDTLLQKLSGLLSKK